MKKKQIADDRDVSIITIIREEKTGCLALVGIILGLSTILTIAIVSYVIAGGSIAHHAKYPHKNLCSRTINLWRCSTTCSRKWFHELG